MTLVRERRHQQPLRLSLPPPIPAADFRHQIHSPSLSLTISPDSPNIEKLSDLEKLAVLGRGNSGTVYKVRHKRSSSIFALKTLRFDRNSTIIRQQAGREAEILRRVDSPYVVQCHAVFDSEDDLYFAMEHMERGSLHDVLLVHRILPEDVISGVARCILNGLQYLHEKQIVHGDIKPSNLLINAEGVVKIADFGVSRVVVGKHDSYETYMGTCAYMSPERIDPERWDGNVDHGFAGDVWSLGVVVLECLAGHYPLIGCGEKPDWAALVCAICFGERLQMPKSASSRIQSFVRRCLEKDWKKRGTVGELLDHPFVTQISFESRHGYLLVWIQAVKEFRLDNKMENLRANGSDDVNQEEMRACHEDDAGFAQELCSKYGVYGPVTAHKAKKSLAGQQDCHGIGSFRLGIDQLIIVSLFSNPVAI
ncbi:hypothetical protein POTOM_004683 [Populus tomentosa]|uniref:mitogen-activated protein kinase kinase n=1 Tax=Populus tomentosa TaxID=118781 RepID=A0A8X8AHT3_POPTO|nr:hypothetical protein POTOM_004683 [Populus tomentosa]